MYHSRDCSKVLHAEANFLQNVDNSGSLRETFCRITMQPPLNELKLKIFSLLHRRNHFGFTRKFLKQVPYVFTVSQIAR